MGRPISAELLKRWSKSSQQLAIRSVFEPIFQAEVDAWDEQPQLQKVDWAGIDKHTKHPDGREFNWGTKFRLADAERYRNVTLTVVNVDGSKGDMYKLPTSFNFYAVTNAESYEIAPTRLLWWVVYEVPPFRKEWDNGCMKPPGAVDEPQSWELDGHAFRMGYSTSSGGLFIAVPLSFLAERGFLKAHCYDDTLWVDQEFNRIVSGRRVVLSHLEDWA